MSITTNILPTVAFGRTAIQITRLISGGNPLVGYSHQDATADAEMQQYFSDQRVVQYLQAVQAAGINTLQARGDYHRILHWVELFRRAGGRLHWIAQTASEMHDVFQNIRILASAGAIGIYHHGSQTDNWWLEGKINRVADYLKCIRDRGVQVGLGTHWPEVIEYAEEKGWDIDFYMGCFYNLNRQKRDSGVVSRLGSGQEDKFFGHDEDPAAMCRVFRATRKQCFAFKILAAGRRCGTQDAVREAFRFAYGQIKPTDVAVVGMFPKHTDQIRLNIEHAVDACARAARA